MSRFNLNSNRRLGDLLPTEEDLNDTDTNLAIRPIEFISIGHAWDLNDLHLRRLVVKMDHDFYFDVVSFQVINKAECNFWDDKQYIMSGTKTRDSLIQPALIDRSKFTFGLLDVSTQ